MKVIQLKPSDIRRLPRTIARLITKLLPNSMLDSLADKCLTARNLLQERARQVKARRTTIPWTKAVESTTGETLKPSVMERNEPWRSIQIPDCQTAGMLTDAEKQYYLFITQFVSGEGEVLELGTWLGMSTFYLLTGLANNPRFKPPLYCFDDFVWRSTSMNKWIHGTAIATPRHLESFQPLFEDFLNRTNLRDQVNISRVKFADYFGNEKLDEFKWTGGPIELIVVDCGRELHVNEAWYRAVRGSLIPGRSLVVMQDWQNYKRVPEIPWEQTKRFTDGKPELVLIHEVTDSAIATFLYAP